MLVYWQSNEAGRSASQLFLTKARRERKILACDAIYYFLVLTSAGRVILSYR
jgi:hypothetical protein